MLLGQMTLPKLSTYTDYLQLDVCGLTSTEALTKYIKFQTKLPIILHGDWTKKGYSENNIRERKEDYISIIQDLKKVTNVLGFTIHPPFRSKVSLDDFLKYVKEIKDATDIPVFIENRSNHKIWVSIPDEIIEFSKRHIMTIDLPQLYISCQFNQDVFIDTLKKIHWNNVKELHIGNIKRQEKRTFVARKLEDGELDFKKIISIIQYVPYGTLEVLGGVPTFEAQYKLFLSLLKIDKGS